MRPWSSLRPVVLWTSKIYLYSHLPNTHIIITSSHRIASRRITSHLP